MPRSRLLGIPQLGSTRTRRPYCRDMLEPCLLLLYRKVVAFMCSDTMEFVAQILYCTTKRGTTALDRLICHCWLLFLDDDDAACVKFESSLHRIHNSISATRYCTVLPYTTLVQPRTSEPRAFGSPPCGGGNPLRSHDLKKSYRQSFLAYRAVQYSAVYSKEQNGTMRFDWRSAYLSLSVCLSNFAPAQQSRDRALNAQDNGGHQLFVRSSLAGGRRLWIAETQASLHGAFCMGTLFRTTQPAPCRV